MRLIRNRGKDGWLGFGKLDFGRKAAKLRIRMDSSAVSFQLSYSSSLVAPDLTLSTLWPRQMPAALMSIGLKQSCRETTATPTVLKSLTQAREQPPGKPPRGGLPEFVPTEEQREIVEKAAGFGLYARWLGDEPDPRDLMRPFPAEMNAHVGDFDTGQQA